MRIVGIVSQKGGVGKTTISVNLAVELKSRGYETLLIDLDTSNPSVGFHVGIQESTIGIKQFLEGQKGLTSYVTVHAPTGLHIIPGTIDAYDYDLTERGAKKIKTALKSMGYDFVVVDTSPGLGWKAVVEDLIDEALIITTPDISSMTSAMRIAEYMDRIGKQHSMLVNRKRRKNYEISDRIISAHYGKNMLGTIGEEDKVMIGIGEHIPATILYKRCAFSSGIHELASYYGAEAKGKRAAKPGKGRISSAFSSLFEKRGRKW